MNSKLEIRRANNEQKCANCSWFQGGETPAGQCGAHGIKVLDLAVCTEWRDGDTLAEILPPAEKPDDTLPTWRSE